jgi:hypothetical protein
MAEYREFERSSDINCLYQQNLAPTNTPEVGDILLGAYNTYETGMNSTSRFINKAFEPARNARIYSFTPGQEPWLKILRGEE